MSLRVKGDVLNKERVTETAESAEKTNPRAGFLSRLLGPELQAGSFPLAFGVGGLKDAGGRHEVLDVLTEDLVLRL